MLVITEKSEQPTAKKEVLVVGRMHPEETVSSYLIEALIKYLLSDGYVPGMLRKTHCFYIVPMLNPDGVILGNSRCSASGRDMNRAWAAGMQEDINPEVVALKRFIAEHKRTLKLVLDFHGHLKKKGCFVYGSHSTQQPYFTRELPFVLNSIDPDNFSFRDSGFCLGMNKAGSTRKAIWQEFGILAYSLECSAFGFKDKTFKVSDYWVMAKNLAESLLVLCQNPLPETTLFERIKAKRVDEVKKNILTKLYSKTDNYEVGLRNEYSDSDSEPEDDYETVVPNGSWKKNSLPKSLEQLSNKLRIEANLEHLIRAKCNEKQPQSIRAKKYAQNELPYISLKEKEHPSRFNEPSKKRSFNEGHSSPLKPRKHIVKFREYRLQSKQIYPTEILYTDMDSQRDKIEAAIQRSRSEKKKIEMQYLRLEEQHQRHSSVKKHRPEKMITLPEELVPVFKMGNQKRKSNLMDTPKYRRPLLSEFVERSWQQKSHS